MACSVGTVFELAAITGVTSFDADRNRLSSQLAQTSKMLELLPKAARRTKLPVIDDDF